MSAEGGSGSDVVRVAASPRGDAGYDVVIGAGAFERLGQFAAAIGAARHAVIADGNVATLYGDAACALLAPIAPASLFPFPPGEASKTRATWAELTDALLAAGIGRDGCIVALGGGVTGDLAGFVAATYMRGLPWIQLPTSLLAMIDASVGGKTGVDVPAGKNLVGAFAPPVVVIADPALLSTLPRDDVRAGLAEAVKHGAIADGAYLDWIMRSAHALLAGEGGPLGQLVRRSVEIKARVVSSDPFERGERVILNFGHTIAHALERITGYALPHGFAVAIGMVAEARIGERAGVTAPGTADRIRRVLDAVGLPAALPDGIAPAALLEAAASDKKARRARLRWSLLADIGIPARGRAGEWTLEIDPAAVAGALSS